MKKKVAEQSVHPQYPDLTWFEDPADKIVEKNAEEAPQVADLLTKIANMEKQLEQSSRANVALTSQPIQPIRPNLATEPDWSNLPDPTTDPEGYAREVHSRAQNAANNRKILEDFDTQMANQGNRKVNALWNAFAERYGQYADKQEMVEFFASKVVAEAADMGMDPNKYMFAHSDRFFEDVVKRMEKAGIKGGESDNLDKEDGGTALQSQDDEVRTAGIFGGLEGGNKPAQGKQAPNTDDMFSELRAVKIKEGWY